MVSSQKKILNTIYHHLYQEFGPQQWWPAQSRFEVIVGAILTQNTNWTNVEKALRNLKKNKVLNPEALKKISTPKLATLIKSAGYYNLKAKRLKNFIEFFFEHFDGKLAKMKTVPLETLRIQLLNVNGIGQETADSILLYALDKPSFVVDAYTKRFLYRHNIIPHDADYSHIRDMFTNALAQDAQFFNEYHALIVNLGKHYCKPKPECTECPLNKLQYSLKYKCSQCARALTMTERKSYQKDDPIICAYCRKN